MDEYAVKDRVSGGHDEHAVREGQDRVSRGHDEHALKDIPAAKLGEALPRGHDEHALKDISRPSSVRLYLADTTNMS